MLDSIEDTDPGHESGLTDGEVIRLGRWEEFSGNFLETKERQEEIVVRFNRGALCVPNDSREAENLRESLSGLEGSTVAILRTDLIGDSFRVRQVSQSSR